LPESLYFYLDEEQVRITQGRTMSKKDSEQTMSQHPFVGIDVSQEHLDVTLLPSTTRRHFANDAAGIVKLAQRLSQSEPELIVLESTGGYESAYTAELAKAGLPVVVVSATLPKPPASWPRPTRSMHRYWRSSPSAFGRRLGHCRRHSRRPWRRFSHAGVRS